MRELLRLSKIIDTVTEWLGIFTYWLVPVVLLVGVYNVVVRYVGRSIGQNLSSNFYIELQWYIFSLIFLLGAGYVLKHDGHVRVDVLYSRWGPRTKAWINLFGALFALIPFSALLIYFSWSAVKFSWEIREMSSDAGGLPRYPIKTFIIVCPILLIIQGMSEFIKNLAFLTGHLAYHEESRESVV